MKKGEVWIVELPARDGYEQHGNRPGVILSDVSERLAVVAPCTGNLAAARFPHAINVVPSEDNGLKKESIIALFQLRVIDKKRIKSRIGHLDEGTIGKLDHEVKIIFSV